MSAMSSLRRLILSFKTFVFCFLLFLLFGCATTQQECPANSNAVYDYYEIYSHVGSLLDLENNKQLPVSGLWRKDIYFIADKVDGDFRHVFIDVTKSISRSIGVSFLPAKSQDDSNAIFIYSEFPPELRSSTALKNIFDSIYDKSESKNKLIDFTKRKSFKQAKVETDEGDAQFFISIFDISGFDDVALRKLYVKSVLGGILPHKVSSTIRPSVFNSMKNADYPLDLTDLDQLIVKAIYNISKEVKNREALAKKAACYVYVNQ